MRKSQRVTHMAAAIAIVSLLSSCAATFPPLAAAKTARITVLYDAFGKDAAMTKDWGYAALVEINGKRILFDTARRSIRTSTSSREDSIC